MREIVFRGKWNNGLDGEAREEEWVYGFLRRSSDGETLIQTTDTSSAIVEAETVDQYTGLQDKNGALIFEGDVLLERYKEPDCDGREGILAEVVFHKGAFMIKEPGEDPEYTLGETHEDFEIVGNVFENKELLEVE